MEVTVSSIIALQLKTELLNKHIESLLTIYHRSTKSKVKSVLKKYRKCREILKVLKQKFTREVIENHDQDKLKKLKLFKFWDQYEIQYS
eukprot:Pgem_evm1s14837